jgi:uncharacterized membrane protein YbhN (UPF0104 family)
MPAEESGGRRWLARVAGMVVVAAVCALLFRGMDMARVLAALRGADGGLVAVAALVNLTLNALARIRRRWALVKPLCGPGMRAGFWDVAALFMISYAGNHVLPARAGDAYGTIELRRRHGFTLEGLLAAQVLERVIEVLSMWILSLPAALLAPPRGALAPAFYTFVMLGLLAAPVMLWLGLRRSEPPVEGVTPATRLGRIRRRLAEATHLLRLPGVWLTALRWSFLSDLADVAMIALCLRATQIDLVPASWFFLYLAVNLAVAVPLTPGQLGVLEAGAVLALGALGVGPSEALAFALVYHAVHVLPMVLAGLVGLWHLKWRAAPT